MSSIKIYIGDFQYNKKDRMYLVDLLKPIVPEINLAKYNLIDYPIQIVKNEYESDYFLLPYSWIYYINTNTTYYANEYIIKANKINKKILIWVTGDYDYSLPQMDNIIALHIGPYKSRQNIFTIVLPVIINDPAKLIEQEEISVLDRELIPIVGFCGHVDSNPFISFMKMLFLLVKNILFKIFLLKYYPGPILPPTYLRKNILDELDKVGRIKTNFIRRDKYQGGIVKNNENLAVLRTEFYNNIEESNYTISIRGTGNYSARFYETLAMGRIPIFINSDCILNFSDLINWKEHIILIEKDEICNMESKVLEFHNNHNQESFKTLQHFNRKIWEKYFSFQGFFNQLIIYLNKE